MNYLAISGLTTSICGTLCAFFLYFSSPRTDTKQICALYNLSMALWGLGLFISFSTLNPKIALFWNKFLNTSAILIPVLFFYFVLLLTNKVQQYKKELVVYMTISFLFLGLAIVFNDHFVRIVEPKMNFKLYPTSGSLYYFFPIQYGYLAIRAILILISEFKNSSGLRKEQLKYILLGNAIGFGGGGTTFFLVFDIKIYPFGAILVPFYLMIQAYAIIKYRLMDIQLA